MSPRAARRLRGYLEGSGIRPPDGVSRDDYPYRYRGLDALLDGALPDRLTPTQPRTPTTSALC